MKERNKGYTAADFARYYGGTMPASEMHALEKAALEDPFLEDALEGFVHTPTAESDIAALQARLANKRKKTTVYFVTSLAQNKWWRIAALFIIMAATVFLFYRVNNGNESPLAKNDVKTARIQQDTPGRVDADTAAIKNQVAFGDQALQKHEHIEKASLPAAKQRTPKKIFTPDRIMKQPATPYSASKTKNSYFDSIDARQSNKESNLSAAPAYVLKGKVTDEEGNAVPYATVTDNLRNKGTVTDTTGRFLLHSLDSNITATASAPGYESKDFAITKDLPSTITMSKTNTRSAETVVTALEKTKQFKKPVTVSKKFKGRLSSAEIPPTGPQPFGGEEKFQQYLKENTLPRYNENNELLTGEVLLSFTVNKKGRPEAIMVLRSSCVACEKEAIRLLEKGPNWTREENMPGTVVIKF